jgi:hypothetical protein
MIQLTSVQHISWFELGALMLEIACLRYLVLFKWYLELAGKGSFEV